MGSAISGNFPQHRRIDQNGAGSDGVDGGGGNGMDNERLVKLETRFDTLLPTLATKADIAETKGAISEAKSEMIKWIVGTALAVTSIGVTVVLFAIGKAAPPQQGQLVQPTIILPVQERVVPAQPVKPEAPKASTR